MNKSPLILLLLLLCILLASALVHQDDPLLNFDNMKDHHLYLAPVPFMQYQDYPADEADFLEDNIIKAETISPKIMLFTSFLKEEDNDVEKLETLVYEYDTLVQNARTNFDLADGSDSHAVENGNISPEMTEKGYLDLSRKSIMQSNMLLRDIFHELKPYISGNDLKLRDGDFAAEGSGMIMLSGDFDADLSVINGSISYMDARDDMKIELEAGHISGEMLSGLRKNMVSYDNINGNITFSGSGYNLAIFGENISLFSNGTGTIKLFGKGHYQFTDHDGILRKKPWVPNLFEDN